MIRTVFLIGVLILSGLAMPEEKLMRKERLSEYSFFQGRLADLIPSEGVLPYDVNTPLFTNYTEKKRFIRFPADGKAVYNDSSAFTLPVGTVLIKNFYFPIDSRKPDGPRQIIETRLLVHQPGGWEAWPYVWNAEQTDALYDPAGEVRNVSFIGENGRKRTVTHAIPNRNQCKGCHVRGESMQPIGITARQLNRETEQHGVKMNQLERWQKAQLLTALPPIGNIPRLSVWNDPASGSLDARARAYLDANCAHCHSRQGPASTSGLFLEVFESDKTRIGIMKTPVAAGRGASNLAFDIVPGKPEQSILVFRMKSTDPGIAMPELGREQVHHEGVALIEEWIKKQTL